jgi:hypothetical protein
MPLVARQGDVKQWHFAHATRGNYRKVQDNCEFSFFVSVRMMARQVVKESLALDLPAYRDSIDSCPMLPSRSRTVEFTVTEARSIVLSEVEVDTSFSGVPVDIVGTIEGFTFVVYFVHPGREVPSALKAGNLADRKSGILAIDLGDVATLFASTRRERLPYAMLLEDFLSHHIESKHWVFHPRYERVREQVNRQISGSLESELAKEASLGSVRQGKFQCVMCGLSWASVNLGQPNCPKCQSHLYVSFKGYVE